jgi:hypothetical protein
MLRTKLILSIISTGIFLGGCEFGSTTKKTPGASGTSPTKVLPQVPQHPILKRQGVSMNYLSNWKVQAYYNTPSIDNPNAPVEARKSKTFFNGIEIIDFVVGNTNKTKFQVDIEELVRPMTLKEAYTKVISKKIEIYRNQNSLGKYHTTILKEPQPVTLKSGQKAYEFIYSRFNGENTVKGKVVFTLNQNVSDELYIFHYQALENEYDLYRTEVEPVFQSIKLLPKDTTVSLKRENVNEDFKENKFFCGMGFYNNNGESASPAPTIFADHHWGNVPVIRFEDTSFKGKGFSPQRRCEEIATRLTDFYHRGLFNHIEIGYLPKSLLSFANTYLTEQGKNTDFSLKVLEKMMNDFKPKKLLEDSSQYDDTIPVVCVSAIKKPHLDIPQEYVGLLMTLKYQDKDNEKNEKIVNQIRNLAEDPELIVIH